MSVCDPKYKASADDCAQVCKNPATIDLPVNQPKAAQPTALHCFVFEVWWRAQTQREKKKQSKGESHPNPISFLHPVSQLVIHTLFNPCSQAIRTTAAPRWSLLLGAAVRETINLQLKANNHENAKRHKKK